jgi:indole-3-glycerol phosphate synthase
MSTPSFLRRMADASRERARRSRRTESEADLLARAKAAAAAPELTLDAFDVIAELKLRSPAAGELGGGRTNLAAQIRAYAQGGAAAVSVLTEPEEFKGALGHLETAVELLRPHGIPAMRKDFLTDPYQVLEARAAGAGGVLLIVAMLSDGDLQLMVDCAAECGLFVLLESFDAEDLERVGRLRLPAAPRMVLIGVNSRDLRTLEVRVGRFAELRASLPAGLPAVAESGIAGQEAIAQVARLGYRLALVGSALMDAARPDEALETLIHSGRAAALGEHACS